MTPPTQGSLFEAGPLFDGRRLTQARALAGITKTELASRIGVTAAAIGQFESGSSSPRQANLDALAKALNVPTGFFNAGRPSLPLDTGAAHFRSLRSMPARDRTKALATTEQAWELIHCLERHVGFPDVDLPRVSADTKISDAADRVRSSWNLTTGPIAHLVAHMESHGIVVVISPSDAFPQADAFSAYVSGRPVVISTMQRANNIFRHRFTMAHELGHLVLHPEAIPGDTTQERQADAFAAAFLTPRHEIAAELPTRMDLTALTKLSLKWGVSVESLIMRMIEIGATSPTAARRAFQRLSSARAGAAADSALQYPGEVPSALRQALRLAEEAGVSIREIAQELQWPAARVRELANMPDDRPKLRLVPEQK